MQMNLLRKVSLLKFRAASCSDAVNPTLCARIGLERTGAAGLVSSVQIGNAYACGYTYDGHLKCTEEALTNDYQSTSQYTFTLTRSYDSSLRPDTKAVSHGAGTFAQNERSYDYEGRLSGHLLSAGVQLSPGGPETLAVAVTHAGGHPTAYAYTFPNGNTLSLAIARKPGRIGWVTGRTYTMGTTTVYSWQASHDALGRPVSTADSESAARTWTYNERSEMTGCGGEDLSGTEQGAGNAPVAKQSGRLSEANPKGRKGLRIGGLLAVSYDGEFYVPIYGGNGNIMGYVDESGTLVAKFVYDPYGNVVLLEGDLPLPLKDGPPVDISGLHGSDFSFGFSTKYHDREVGLIAYQLRSYSPVLGRWLNRDPIEEEGGVNLYVFCGNLTIDKHLGSSLDYLGLSCCPGEIRIISIVYADASSISRGNPDFKNLRELLRNLELLNYIQLGISGVSSVLDGLIAGVEKGVTSAAASGADFIVGKAVSLDGGVGVSAIEQMYTRYKVNFPQLRGWLYYQQCEKHMLIFTRWVDKSISSTEAVAIDLHGMDGSNPIKTFEAAEAEIKAELLTKFKKVLGGGR